MRFALLIVLHQPTIAYRSALDEQCSRRDETFEDLGLCNLPRFKSGCDETRRQCERVALIAAAAKIARQAVQSFSQMTRLCVGFARGLNAHARTRLLIWRSLRGATCVARCRERRQPGGKPKPLAVLP